MLKLLLVFLIPVVTTITLIVLYYAFNILKILGGSGRIYNEFKKRIESKLFAKLHSTTNSEYEIKPVKPEQNLMVRILFFYSIHFGWISLLH
jgi:hypothetical protein